MHRKHPCRSALKYLIDHWSCREAFAKVFSFSVGALAEAPWEKRRKFVVNWRGAASSAAGWRVVFGGFASEDRHDRSKHRLQQVYIRREKTWKWQWWLHKCWKSWTAASERPRSFPTLTCHRDRAPPHSRRYSDISQCWAWLWLAVWWSEWRTQIPCRSRCPSTLWILLDPHIQQRHFHQRTAPSYCRRCTSTAARNVRIPKLKT